MILLLGYSSESTFGNFCDFCLKKETEFAVFDLVEFIHCDTVKIEQGVGHLVISFDDKVYDFAKYESFYTRMYYLHTEDKLKNQAFSKLISAINTFIDHSHKIVINRPSSGNSNSNKLIHLHELKEIGFDGPDTYIFGDSISAEKVLNAENQWISKSCSGMKTVAVGVDEELYHNLHKLSICPSLFQNRITGPDVRVHVINNEFYPEIIVSLAVDYRFNKSGAKNVYKDCSVPDHIKKLCLAYCKLKNIAFVGFDFKISNKDQKWYILEANPMPGYESYDQRQNNRISNALLTALLSKT